MAPIRSSEALALFLALDFRRVAEAFGDARDTEAVTSRGPRQAHLEGFDLHANVWVSAHERAGLERLGIPGAAGGDDAAAGSEPADLSWCVETGRSRARGLGGGAGRRSGRHRDDAHAERLDLGGPHAPGIRIDVLACVLWRMSIVRAGRA